MTPNPNPSSKCRYCGGAGKFQVVSPVSDHAWATCFCSRALTPPTPAETVTVALPGAGEVDRLRAALADHAEAEEARRALVMKHSVDFSTAAEAILASARDRVAKARETITNMVITNSAPILASLATVAAANDEGVAEQVSRLRDAYDAVEYWPERRGDPMTVGGAGFIDLLKLRNLVAELLDDPAAIRLFSQGGGK